jgi:hypothetical protein
MCNSLIDFLVIGTQKAATSWIYQCLKEHPEIELPANKYEVEYLGGNLSQIYGSDWYFGLMSSREMAIRGDVSVKYLDDARSPKMVKDYAPNVKLVVILREPIARALSAYAWSRKTGFLSPNFPSTAEEMFQLILDKEYQCYPIIKDNLAYFVTRGFYDNKLFPWFELFDPSAFMIITYDEIQNAPIEVTKSLFNFLGVSTEFAPSSLHSQPKKTNYSIPEPHQTKKLNRLERLNFRIRKKLHQLINKNQDVPSSVFTLSKQTKDQLFSLYRSHIQSTDKIIQSVPQKQRPKDTLINIWKY